MSNLLTDAGVDDLVAAFAFLQLELDLDELAAGLQNLVLVVFHLQPGQGRYRRCNLKKVYVMILMII